MDATTFAQLLTPAGIVIAGALVTSLVQLLKGALPTLGDRVSGALQAFAISLAIYVLAGIATGASTLDAGLVVFESWLACALAAVGTYSAARHVADSR